MSRTICRTADCRRISLAHGLCHRHYYAAKRSGEIVARGEGHKVCIIDGCSAGTAARGLCSRHYSAARADGSISQYAKINSNSTGACMIEGCDGDVFGRSLCRPHYMQHAKSGKLPRSPACVTDGCRSSAMPTRKHCHYHHYRSLAGHAVDRVQRQWGIGRRLDESGYVWLYKPDYPVAVRGNYVLEHRYLGWLHLGRPLTEDENVHHRDGDRANNTIGPCFLSSECRCPERHNLELWSTTQPSGQRVSDKVRWAKEILKLYGEQEP